jgi:hypothetical protein
VAQPPQRADQGVALRVALTGLSDLTDQLLVARGDSLRGNVLGHHYSPRSFTTLLAA